MTWELRGDTFAMDIGGIPFALPAIDSMLVETMLELPSAYFTPTAPSRVWFWTPEAFVMATFNRLSRPDLTDSSWIGHFLDEAMGPYLGEPVRAMGIQRAGLGDSRVAMWSLNALGEARSSGAMVTPVGMLVTAIERLPNHPAMSGLARAMAHHLWGPAWTPSTVTAGG